MKGSAQVGDGHGRQSERAFSSGDLAALKVNNLIDPSTETTYGVASTGTPFLQNAVGQYVIPTSRISPQSLALYNALANLPNNPAGGFNNYINTNPEIVTQSDLQFKVDQIVNSKTRLMGEYFDTRQTDNLPSEEWLGSAVHEQ